MLEKKLEMIIEKIQQKKIFKCILIVLQVRKVTLTRTTSNLMIAFFDQAKQLLYFLSFLEKAYECNMFENIILYRKYYFLMFKLFNF